VYDAPKDAFRPRNASKQRPDHDRPRAPALARTADHGAHQHGTAEPAVARASKKKAERPKFDVTCIECGTAAQVPFKPIEGREVFCQPCYRARRGVAAPAVASADGGHEPSDAAD
jgi:CxxC-x17-CxxC domain-containing protein